MANILIIDDDPSICETLANVAGRMGHTTSHAHTLREGVGQVRSGPYDVVFLDVQLPDGNGLEAISTIRGAASRPEVIIVTGHGDPDGAELAIKCGAWDYIEKPPSLDSILLPLTRVFQYRQEKTGPRPALALKREGIVGGSPQIRQCLDLVAGAAGTDTTVLITGQTGTGKELFARAIHENSARAAKTFVAVDCAALPEGLVASTLFGHEKGAFTGAERIQEGLVKQADGGTLFLDEVGELPPDIQSAFLRVLQERRFRTVGGNREIASDFRLIAATNRNLDAMVSQGAFRSDLLHRLCSAVIELPPLKERTGDIKELLFHYLPRFCERYRMATKGFSPEFLEALTSYPWPGNVRELVNALERALSVAAGEPVLFPVHLPTHIRARLARESVAAKPASGSVGETFSPVSEPYPKLRSLLETTEKQYLVALLSSTGGNIKEVCRISGLSRSRLYERLKKYGL